MFHMSVNTVKHTETTHRSHIYQYRCFPYMKCKPSSIDFTSEDIIIQFHFDRFTFIYVWYRIIIRTICSLLFFCVFILWKWFHFLLLECFIPFMVFFSLSQTLWSNSFSSFWHSVNLPVGSKNRQSTIQSGSVFRFFSQFNFILLSSIFIV